MTAMFLLVIILSYLLGCASTLALLLYLYARYAISAPTKIDEWEEEQYQTFQPLPEVKTYFYTIFHICMCPFSRMNELKIQLSMP